jgi:hypothetical protein
VEIWKGKALKERISKDFFFVRVGGNGKTFGLVVSIREGLGGIMGAAKTNEINI